MKLITDPRALRRIQSQRSETFLPRPRKFAVKNLPFLPDRVYVMRKAVTVSGIASFENKPMTIEIGPMAGSTPTLHYGKQSLPLLPRLTEKGRHNIQLGEVKIIEHMLSLMTCLHIDADLRLSEPSFPTFDFCNRPLLQAVRRGVADGGPAQFFTVKRPFALEFKKGYVMLEPDDGKCRLFVDHEIRYPGKSIGTQRFAAQIDPSFYAFLSAARTPSFRPVEETRSNVRKLKAREPIPFPVTLQNVLFVDEERIHNPRRAFDHARRNYEFMMHELIDVTAWLKFVDIRYGGQFAGRMTTLFFDHHAQIDAARFVCDALEFASEIGMKPVSG